MPILRRLPQKEKAPQIADAFSYGRSLLFDAAIPPLPATLGNLKTRHDRRSMACVAGITGLINLVTHQYATIRYVILIEKTQS